LRVSAFQRLASLSSPPFAVRFRVSAFEWFDRLDGVDRITRLSFLARSFIIALSHYRIAKLPNCRIIKLIILGGVNPLPRQERFHILRIHLMVKVLPFGCVKKVNERLIVFRYFSPDHFHG